MNNSGSLLSKQAMGGIIGGGGYDFQDAYIISNIPIWLQDSKFHSFMKEGFGDVDVHFEDGDGHTTTHEYYQIKDHQLAPAEFRTVLTAFKGLNDKKPDLFTKFTIVSLGLAPDLQRLKTSVTRYREAKESYQEKDLKETKDDLFEIMEKLKVSDSLDFICAKLVFDDELFGLQNPLKLKDLFCGALLPSYGEKAPSLRQTFAPVYSMVSLASGKPLTRLEIINTIDSAIEAHKKEIAKSGFLLRVYHWEDEPFIDKESYGSVLDWSTRFNRRQRIVPSTEIWEKELLPELVNLQMNLRKTTGERRIHIEGSACLSAGFSIGWAFPEVAQWVIKLAPRIGPRTELWSSDGSPSEIDLPTIEEEFADGEDIAVRYGVVASVVGDFNKFVDESGLRFRAVVDISNPEGVKEIITNQTALSYSRAAKTIIRNAAKKYSSNRVHLFFSGPLGMAIYFGQLFNSMPDIQLYEQKHDGGYQPSALLRSA